MKELQLLADEKLANAGIQLEIDEYDKKLLSKCPTAVFVCNQLLPGLDEWVLFKLLNEHFEAIHLLHPYPTPPARALKPFVLKNLNGQFDPALFQTNMAKQIVRHIKRKTALTLVIDFSENPVGVMGKNLLRSRILRQLRKARQPIVPIHLVPDRHMGGILKRALSSLAIGAAPEPVRVQVRVGLPIQGEDIKHFESNRLWAKYLQAKIFSLGAPFDLKPEDLTLKAPEKLEPIAEPIDPELVAAEMDALPPGRKMCSKGQFDVYIAPFSEIPNTMMDIGRLREISFRAVGEGSGKSRDIDEYDIFYLQLIIWDREQKRIAGGYRLAQSDVIFNRFGVNGLYVSSLFKISQGFYPVLQQAVELGRSYVVPDYQRHRLPLFLLWKGILIFLVANPQYRYLYGPVSISKHYSEVSKSMIVEFVKQYFFDHEMALNVRPRKPFRPKIRSVDTKLMAESMPAEFDALESLIEDIEPKHFKVPVLFRQYLRQSAKFIAFNVDPLFSDCLDGLMVLDIRQLPESTIENLQND